jgi:hypothetical protein
MDLSAKHFNKYDKIKLNNNEKNNLKEWYDKYSSKYPKIAKLKY